MFTTFCIVKIKIHLFSDINIIHDKDTDYSYLWSKLNTTDVSQYSPTMTEKVMFMAIDLDQIECGTKSGYIMILDSNNFSLSHALRWSIFDARNLMKYFQVSFSCEPFLLFKQNN